MKVIDENMLDRFRHATSCSWCSRPTPTGCDPAHYIAKGTDSHKRMDLPENLASLCRRCHTSSHDGNEPTPDQLAVVIAAREELAVEPMKNFLWAVQRANNTDDPTPVLAKLRARYLGSVAA